MSKHYVAITPLYPFPQPKFHRYVSACLGIGTHILSHLYFHFMGRYIRGHATQRARPALVYTRQISSPVPSINQSPYYVVHRFGFIANPSVNYAFPSVFQCRLDRLHPIGSYLPPRPSPESFRQLPNFRPAHTRPLCARERRGRDYLWSTRNWTFLTQGYVLDGTAISDVDKREIRTNRPLNRPRRIELSRKDGETHRVSQPPRNE